MSIWDDISDACKNLIPKLLTAKETRLKSNQILEHPWLKTAIKDWPAKVEVTASITKNLKAFKNAQKLKKAVLTYIATQLSEKEIAPLRALFKSLDTNGDGKLSHHEIKQGLKGRADEKELTDLMISIDTDNNGYIEYNGNLSDLILLEFLAAAMGGELSFYKERLYEAFCLFDKDKSGKISIKELKRIIKQELCDDTSAWTKILEDADSNGDGEIDFIEFQSVMYNASS